jgi:flagellar hook-basal body complex protein FliE
MNQIAQIRNFIPLVKPEIPATQGDEVAGFADRLKKILGEVNDLQLQAGELSAKFAAGEIEDVHDVMIAAEKASVSFEMVMEVRNKLIEAYREMMRMQI